MRICDLENENKCMSEYIIEVEEENNIFYNKLKLYERDNVESVNKLSDIVSRIGRSCPEEYKVASIEKYNKMKEDMRKRRIEMRQI